MSIDGYDDNAKLAYKVLSQLLEVGSTNHTRSMCICIWTLWLSCSQRFLSYLALGVPDEGFSRNGRVRWVWNLRFYYYHWVDTTSAGGWLVLEGSIHPVISVSALTCFIRYIFYCNLQLLNYVFIMKTPPSIIGELYRFLAILFIPFGFLSSKDA